MMDSLIALASIAVGIIGMVFITVEHWREDRRIQERYELRRREIEEWREVLAEMRRQRSK
jgi:hypothetical protein